MKFGQNVSFLRLSGLSVTFSLKTVIFRVFLRILLKMVVFDVSLGKTWHFQNSKNPEKPEVSRKGPKKTTKSGKNVKNGQKRHFHEKRLPNQAKFWKMCSFDRSILTILRNVGFDQNAQLGRSLYPKEAWWTVHGLWDTCWHRCCRQCSMLSRVVVPG